MHSSGKLSRAQSKSRRMPSPDGRPRFAGSPLWIRAGIIISPEKYPPQQAVAGGPGRCGQQPRFQKLFSDCASGHARTFSSSANLGGKGACPMSLREIVRKGFDLLLMCFGVSAPQKPKPQDVAAGESREKTKS
jgi:hypothetical protein